MRVRLPGRGAGRRLPDGLGGRARSTSDVTSGAGGRRLRCDDSRRRDDRRLLAGRLLRSGRSTRRDGRRRVRSRPERRALRDLGRVLLGTMRARSDVQADVPPSERLPWCRRPLRVRGRVLLTRVYVHRGGCDVWRVAAVRACRGLVRERRRLLRRPMRRREMHRDERVVQAGRRNVRGQPGLLRPRVQHGRRRPAALRAAPRMSRPRRDLREPRRLLLIDVRLRRQRRRSLRGAAQLHDERHEGLRLAGR